MGNRHLGNNVRILLVNNSTVMEFKNYNHYAAIFGEDADMYVAASGHLGRKSRALAKHYAKGLGLEYLSAYTKEELDAAANHSLTP